MVVMLVHKIWRCGASSIFFGLCILVLCFLSLTVHPFIAGWAAEQGTYLYFFTSAVLLLVTLLIYYNKLPIFCFSPIDLAIAGFVLYFIGRQLVQGISNLKDDHLLSLLATVCIYVTLRIQFAENKLAFPTYLIIWGLAISFELAIGYGQCLVQLLNKEKLMPSGTLQNPNVYAGFLSLALPALLFMPKIPVSAIQITRLGLVFAFLITVMLFLTGSRTSLLATSIGMACIYKAQIYALFSRQNNRIRRWVIGCLFLFIVLFACLMVVKAPSLYGRLLIWKASLPMLTEAPLIGQGAGSFVKHYMSYQAAYFRAYPHSAFSLLADNTYYAFNEPLQLLIEMGAMGLLLALLVCWLAFKVRLPVIPNWSSAAKAALLISLMASLFSYNLHCTNQLTLICSFLALLAITDVKRISIRVPVINKVIYGCVLLIILVFVCFLILQWRAHLLWKRAEKNLLENEYAAFRQYDHIYAQLQHRNMFLYNYGTSLYELRHFNKSKILLKDAEKMMGDVPLQLYLGKVSEQTGQLKEAEAYYIRAGEMVPKLMYPKYYLLQLYIGTHQLGKAFTLAKEIINMPEKIPSEATAQIKEEARRYLQLSR